MPLRSSRTRECARACGREQRRSSRDSFALPKHADAADAHLRVLGNRVQGHDAHVQRIRGERTVEMQPVDHLRDLQHQRYSRSPVLVGDRRFVCSEQGHAAGQTFGMVARVSTVGEG